MSPLGGERHMRVTSAYAIDGSEVGTGLSGDSPGKPRRGTPQEFMRLFLEIAYWTQAVKEADEDRLRRKLAETVELAHAAAQPRPGVLRRHALRSRNEERRPVTGGNQSQTDA